MNDDGLAEAKFWALIEEAWRARGPAVNEARAALATRDPADEEAEAEAVDEVLDEVVADLRVRFATMSREELAAMDRVLERKLYELDRQDVQQVTDGSDDGFLYARGYIVALGKAFFSAVCANPAMAVMDAECEEMCYLPAHVYAKRFGGKFPEHESGISRESGSNAEGWKD